MVMLTIHSCHQYAYIIAYGSLSCTYTVCLTSSRQVSACGVVYTICDMHGYTLVIPLLYHYAHSPAASYTKYIMGIHVIYGVYHYRYTRYILRRVPFPTLFFVVHKCIPHISHVIPCYTCISECYTIVHQLIAHRERSLA